MTVWLRALEAAENLMAVIAGGLLVFVGSSISYSILARATGLPAPVWIIQFTEYSLLWITFLGAPWLLRKGGHVSIDMLMQRLSAPASRLMGRVHGLVGAALCGLLGGYSGYAVWENFERGIVDVQSIDVPKGLVLLVIPIGFTLLTLRFLALAASPDSRPAEELEGAAETPAGLSEVP